MTLNYKCQADMEITGRTTEFSIYILFGIAYGVLRTYLKLTYINIDASSDQTDVADSPFISKLL